MQCYCSYHVNTGRIGVVLDNLINKFNVQIHPVRGTMTSSKMSVTTFGPVQEFIVYSDSSDLPLLITNNHEHADHDGTVIDYEPTTKTSFYKQLVDLIVNKAVTAVNDVELELSTNDNCTLCIYISDSQVSYAAKSSKGTMIINLSDGMDTLFDSCTGLKSFRYSLSAAQADRDVRVSRGMTDILKEICHFCGKSLLFSKIENDVITKEYCVSFNGCFVFYRDNDSGILNAKRVPSTKIDIDDSYAVKCLYEPGDKIAQNSSRKRGV